MNTKEPAIDRLKDEILDTLEAPYPNLLVSVLQLLSLNHRDSLRYCEYMERAGHTVTTSSTINFAKGYRTALVHFLILFCKKHLSISVTAKDLMMLLSDDNLMKRVQKMELPKYMKDALKEGIYD